MSLRRLHFTNSMTQSNKFNILWNGEQIHTLDRRKSKTLTHKTKGIKEEVVLSDRVSFPPNTPHFLHFHHFVSVTVSFVYFSPIILFSTLFLSLWILYMLELKNKVGLRKSCINIISEVVIVWWKNRGDSSTLG